MSSSRPPLTPKDFQSDQDVRWCPGCGDYAILKSVQHILPDLGVPRENIVFVSGIGCASRFPYYMNTYGFHTIHGRAPAIATGLKLANPDLSVWVITGDGDALSIGLGHLLHAFRRNIDLNILLFNNRIYGLTKGQTSPASERGKRTKSTPHGSLAAPLDPITLALATGATFVARSVDIYASHLRATLARAAAHRGTSFVEIYQNCNIFNDGAFHDMTDRDRRADAQLELTRGEPLVFGRGRELAVRYTPDFTPEIVSADTADLPRHDPSRSDVSFASALSRLAPPDFPTPIGVFREISTATYEAEVPARRATRTLTGNPELLDEILRRSETWTVT